MEDVSTTEGFMEVSKRYLENAVKDGSLFNRWEFWVVFVGIVLFIALLIKIFRRKR